MAALSTKGSTNADFDRAVGSLSEAIISAIQAIESLPGLRIVRVEPDDLVTAAEIAKRLNRTRESVRLLAAGRRGSRAFPRPVSHLRHRTRLWRWSDVSAWAGGDPAEVSDAHLIAALNAALQLRSNGSALPEEARTLLVPFVR